MASSHRASTSATPVGPRRYDRRLPASTGLRAPRPDGRHGATLVGLRVPLGWEMGRMSHQPRTSIGVDARRGPLGAAAPVPSAVVPRFVVVSDDPRLCTGLVADLDRRFGRDYEVTGGSPAAVEELLRRSAAEDRP